MPAISRRVAASVQPRRLAPQERAQIPVPRVLERQAVEDRTPGRHQRKHVEHANRARVAVEQPSEVGLAQPSVDVAADLDADRLGNERRTAEPLWRDRPGRSRPDRGAARPGTRAASQGCVMTCPIARRSSPRSTRGRGAVAVRVMAAEIRVAHVVHRFGALVSYGLVPSYFNVWPQLATELRIHRRRAAAVASSGSFSARRRTP